MRRRMTAGTLPTHEEFKAAFREECPDGVYRIRNSPEMGNADLSEWELWVLLDTLTRGANEGGEDEFALASCILETLGFEWV